MTLTCPICQNALQLTGRSYQCTNRHSFDLAKSGYLSLLHGRQQGAGRGDTKEMIVARDRVHRAGVFDPLLAALNELRFETAPQSILELGCGEGFFLSHMVAQQHIATSYGLDLSEDAVKLAARSCKSSLILRADLLQPLPFASESLNLVQSIFAPRPLVEIKRVLRPGGYALFVFPETDHWSELREFVPLAKIGEEKSPASVLTNFLQVVDQPVRASIELTRATLIDLVEMSPSIHRLTREKTAWRDSVPSSLVATLSLRVALYQKK